MNVKLIAGQEATRRNALDVTVRSLAYDHRLPDRVFEGAWEDFLFCESDRLFDAAFVNVVIQFLGCENSRVACLLNLDRTDLTRFEESGEAIFLDRSTTGAQYMNALEEGGPSRGWLYAVDRYVCCSDIGEWCIYCEKDNDIAVVALRQVSKRQDFECPLKQLGARPIEELIEGGAWPLFPFNQLVPSWREGLLMHYGR
ncbi:hypothetical protein [Trinickia diaoshuihuensis]|jgi:hypothetical protein|uniref:hypothetical protein n=1 Tax=Trinickia diaoshuihuensis TaxID=2292265 RepID=UPI000E23E752|nr:hypothetical protein [Trinickia diaoshuihuensis]